LETGEVYDHTTCSLVCCTVYLHTKRHPAQMSVCREQNMASVNNMLLLL